MWHVTSILTVLLWAVASVATEVPNSLSYGGTLQDSAGNPIETNPVTFTVQVITPDGNECVLYEETHSLNMTGTGGDFSLQLGTGSRAGGNYEDTSVLKDIIANDIGLQSALTCSVGSTYNPSSGDSRFVRINVNDGTFNETLSPDIAMNSVANALYANSLQGKVPGDLIQVNTGSAQLTQADVESVFASPANVTELLALIAGTSSQYVTSGGAGDITDVVAGTGLTGGAVTGSATLNVDVDTTSIGFNGNSLEVVAGGINASHLASGAVGSLQILDGSVVDADIGAGAAIAWTKINKAGATAADVNAADSARAINAGTGLTGGGDLTTDRTLNVDVGTAANQIVQLDGSARLPAVDGSLLTNLPGGAPSGAAGGSLSGTYPNPTIATNAVGAAQIAANSVGASEIVDNSIADIDINNVSVSKLINGVGEYFTYQPNNIACADSEVLKWNSANTRWECAADNGGGGGLTSLNGQTGGSQTFATGTGGTSPSWGSGGNTHTLDIPMASAPGVTAGLLSKTDYDSFNAKVDSARTIGTLGDSGLIGGGNLSANRTLSVDINGTTSEIANDNLDEILIYDNSAGQLRKQNRGDFLSGVGSLWLPMTTDIYYTAGNVGIGTTAPPRALTVAGGANALIAIEQASGGFPGTAGYATLKADLDGRLYYKDGTNPQRVIATLSTGLNFKDLDFINDVLIDVVDGEDATSLRYLENGLVHSFWDPSRINSGTQYELVNDGDTNFVSNRDSTPFAGGGLVNGATTQNITTPGQSIVMADNDTESAYWNMNLAGDFELTFTFNFTNGAEQVRFGLFNVADTGVYNGDQAEGGFYGSANALSFRQSGVFKSNGSMFNSVAPGIGLNNGDIITIERSGSNLKVTSSSGGVVEMNWITANVHFWVGADNMTSFSGVSFNNIQVPSLTNAHDMTVTSKVFNNSNVGDATNARIAFVVEAPNSPVGPADFIAKIKEGPGAFRTAALSSRPISDVLTVYYGTADMTSDTGDGNLEWEIQTVGGAGTKMINIYSVSVEVEN